MYSYVERQTDVCMHKHTHTHVNVSHKDTI